MSNVPKSFTCQQIAEYAWAEKYKVGEENSILDTLIRTAKGVANGNKSLESKFEKLLTNNYFIPGGRILANAGTDRCNITFSNCFYVDAIPDSMVGIFSLLQESALIMQAGGGIGIDFSLIRPKGDRVKSNDSLASGPVSFAKLWDTMCETVASAGARRGAMLGSMNIEHPDIEIFIDAKEKNECGVNKLSNFNLSVAISDDFMEVLSKDEEWFLMFDQKIRRKIKASDLWDKIMRSNYLNWEPGVLFISRANSMNNLYYCETFYGTNPCGEQFLGPYQSCNLGSMILPSFISNPFTDEALFNFKKFSEAVRLSVKFLDSVLDINQLPLEKLREGMIATRRIGLGFLGLTDALTMMNLRYDSEQGRKFVEEICREMRDSSYDESVNLAIEKGSFPKFDKDKYCDSLFIKTLPESLQKRIKDYGIRNSHLLTVAPTGTISMVSNNMTSGIEPYFFLEYNRTIRIGTDGDKIEVILEPYSCELYKKIFSTNNLPEIFKLNVSSNIHYKDHIRMQGSVQKYLDASISKTIILPEDISYEEFKDAYLFAYEQGLKGCTTYRPHSGREGIIKDSNEKKEIIQTSAPAKIPRVLAGERYKFKHPEKTRAYYVHIYDIEENGKIRPFEIFINTMEIDSEWTSALTRMISAIFRKSNDASFVAEELMQIQNIHTGFWNAERKKHVPSIVAELGEIIQEHYSKLSNKNGNIDPLKNIIKDGSKYMSCPKCGKKTLTIEEGCPTCVNPDCGYSKCGGGK